MSILNKLLAEEADLTESVTFQVAVLEDDPKYGKMYNTAKFAKEEDAECWVCNGTGKDHLGDDVPCDMCHGDGKIKEWVYPYKALNVSNENAKAILTMLGHPWHDDACGAWEAKDLPDLRRKLIRLKNTDSSKHSEAPRKEVGSVKTYKDDSGMDHIGRGPTIYHGGRSQEQIDKYVDAMLDMVEFAQKNQATVTWC